MQLRFQKFPADNVENYFVLVTLYDVMRENKEEINYRVKNVKLIRSPLSKLHSSLYTRDKKKRKKKKKRKRKRDEEKLHDFISSDSSLVEALFEANPRL